MKKYIVLILIIMVFQSVYGNGNQEPMIAFNYEVSIEGMTCPLCSIAVEKRLNKLDWITGVKGDHDNGLALIKVDNAPDMADMEKAIAPKLNEIGYKLIKIRKLTDDKNP